MKSGGLNLLEPSRSVQACNIEPILLTDDTSVIISSENFIDFTTPGNQVLASMIEWFSASMLVLNLEKTNIMRFVTINQPYCALTISHKDK
jgi:hypothetical protein